ncbi:NAD-dependent epimerase/dehydratase [Crinalium epipsammum PCC 9333]|uniref:NAD-dependent epimerase/dehydratase n=1 Tax=Crinalium epipsammum PCC 9333 TaxID=1173022 RepID=K9W1H7_9CYAN|nr:NAD(P)-dependent oxidoreductase [Crinalium epipsammum]AFZ14228.1 NAD-dependent epimerase/dehydratase [Crinalium epipsammum PCC 9333]
MKKVLVTGASGFMGRHCLPLLAAKGYELHAVSSQIQSEKLSDVYWHQTDLLKLGAIWDLIAKVQPTHLLHFAWFVTPGKFWTSTENLRWVQASLELLQAFAHYGGQRVVMAGTCAEYDWNYGYCSEQVTPLLPATLYGTCKHSLQIMLDAFAKEKQLSAAWGRIFFLYGMDEHPDRLISSVMRSLLQGEPARCSHGNQIRDFLYVEDVAAAFVALLDSDVTGAVNIASGYPVTLKDVIYKIAEKINRKDLVKLGVVPTSASEPRLLVADVSRLTNEVGWLPKYNLEQGLDQTLAWWRQGRDSRKF